MRTGTFALAAIDEASSSFRVRAVENNKKEVECANRTSHIARPCPSAAGDYVDYRMMIRTPPAPPSLPPWCYTGPEVEGSEI